MRRCSGMNLLAHVYSQRAFIFPNPRAPRCGLSKSSSCQTPSASRCATRPKCTSLSPFKMLVSVCPFPCLALGRTSVVVHRPAYAATHGSDSSRSPRARAIVRRNSARQLVVDAQGRLRTDPISTAVPASRIAARRVSLASSPEGKQANPRDSYGW